MRIEATKRESGSRASAREPEAEKQVTEQEQCTSYGPLSRSAVYVVLPRPFLVPVSNTFIAFFAIPFSPLQIYTYI
jgi:hypothetical protein